MHILSAESKFPQTAFLRLLPDAVFHRRCRNTKPCWKVKAIYENNLRHWHLI